MWQLLKDRMYFIGVVKTQGCYIDCAVFDVSLRNSCKDNQIYTQKFPDGYFGK